MMETFDDIINSMDRVVESVILDESVFEDDAEKDWQLLKPGSTIIIKGRNIVSAPGLQRNKITNIDYNKRIHSGLYNFALSLAQTLTDPNEGYRLFMSTSNPENYVSFYYKQDGETKKAVKDVELGMRPTAPLILVISLAFTPATIEKFSTLVLRNNEIRIEAKKEKRKLTPEETAEIEKNKIKIRNIRKNAKTIQYLIGYNPLETPGKRGEISFDKLKEEVAECIRLVANGLQTQYKKETELIAGILKRLENVTEESIFKIRLGNEPANLSVNKTMSKEDIENERRKYLNTFKQALSFTQDNEYKTTKVYLYIKVPQIA